MQCTLRNVHQLEIAVSKGYELTDTLFSMQIEKEEQAAAEKAVGKEEFQGEWSAPAAEFTQPEVADWSEGVAVPSVPIQQFPAGMFLFF